MEEGAANRGFPELIRNQALEMPLRCPTEQLAGNKKPRITGAFLE